MTDHPTDPRAVADDPSGIVQQMPEADLQAEVERLRTALRPFAEVTILPTGAVVGMERFWFDRARAALSPETDGGQDD